MNIRNTHKIAARLSGALVLASLCLLAACAKVDQKGWFKTPEEAVSAFVAALEKGDVQELEALMGPGAQEILSSGDPIQDQADRARFLEAYNKKHAIQDGTDGAKTLVIGDTDWAFPVPIVQKDGRWHLDGAAGADELIYRRVGANELGAIQVALGFVAAQNDYAAQGHDGDPPGVYALKLISDDGMQNGLYWPTAEGEPESPAGPFLASAADEGYHFGEDRQPYHGYYYRMLYAQGPNANGGAKEYFADGVLTQGFALVAWPADYGASGVQTFIVNQDGVVFQKDLGDDTANLVEQMKLFDPDAGWKAVAPQDENATS